MTVLSGFDRITLLAVVMINAVLLVLRSCFDIIELTSNNADICLDGFESYHNVGLSSYS